jgi:hypothetical protein
MADADMEARTILEKLIRSFNKARTLYCEITVAHPKPGAAPVAGQASAPSPVTRRKYYFLNDGDLTRIRVESSATVSGMNLSTLFIKNVTGIWEVWAEMSGEVSKVFTHDQLLGVFPFFRLFACLQHPYELQLAEENRGGAKYFVISGKLAEVPVAGTPDIAREFTYWIGKADGLLHSIHERTFAKRAINLEMDKVELNQPLDPALFEIPDKPKFNVSDLAHYMELRNQDMGQRLRS